jgi:DNA-binding NarL/FixJ family response regulator
VTKSVLVVEDSLETRARFVRAVESDARLRLHAAVGSCAEADGALRQQPGPDVALIDLGLPDGSGIDVIRSTRALHPSTLVLVVTVFGEQTKVIESVRAGASGYLLKDCTLHQIGDAILDLLAGGSPLSAAVARHVLRQLQSAGAQVESAVPAAADVPRLTRRELEILELLARGFRSAELADMLGISAHTVVTHTRSIHRKLEVSSRSEAIYEAVHLGLIRLSD